MLRERGYVDNYMCIQEKITLRLGAVIHVLKAEGWKFDEVKSGYVPGTKNWRYILKKSTPTYEWKIYVRDGTRYAKKVLKLAREYNGKITG